MVVATARARAPEALLALGVAVVQVAGTHLAARGQSEVHPLDAAGHLLLLAGPAALARRRRHPVAVLVVVLAVTVAYRLPGYPVGPVYVSLVAAYLHAAVRGRRWPASAVLVAGYLALVWAVPLARGEAPGPGAALGVAAWLLVLLAVAELVRQRRAAVAAGRQREEEALRTREEERRRRASEERLDVARELHDVLGHSLSMINVQSGVALELLDRRPEQARAALAAIKTASREALVEVQAVLDSLRSPGERVATTPAATPAATVADLDALVAHARAAGLEVSTRVEGTAVPVPGPVDVAAARIVREALTNVARHAAGARAAVVLRHGPGALHVRVDDDGPGTPAHQPRGGGSGVPGMRRRAEALGGELHAGPREGGGFSVTARLPWPPSGSP